jgi:hypothetical protein
MVKLGELASMSSMYVSELCIECALRIIIVTPDDEQE